MNEELPDSEFQESLWCNVELDHQRLLVGLCYRNPTSTTINDGKLLHLLEKAVLQAKSHNVVIMGDFNYPEIDYNVGTVASGACDSSNLFFNTTQELFLFQHVSEATRVRQHQTPSTLDYVFTDEENLIDVIRYEAPLGKSDHVVLTWNLLLAVQEIDSKQIKFDYHRGNYSDIQNSLQAVNWKDRWEGKTVCEMWMDFTQILKAQVNLHVPWKKVRKGRGKKLPKHIQKLIHKRGKVWQKYQQYKCGSNFVKYKQIRNKVNSAIRREEKYSRKQILKSFKGNPKRFYGYMRHTQAIKDIKER